MVEYRGFIGQRRHIDSEVAELFPYHAFLDRADVCTNGETILIIYKLKDFEHQQAAIEAYLQSDDFVNTVLFVLEGLWNETPPEVELDRVLKRQGSSDPRLRILSSREVLDHLMFLVTRPHWYNRDDILDEESRLNLLRSFCADCLGDLRARHCKTTDDLRDVLLSTWEWYRVEPDSLVLGDIYFWNFIDGVIGGVKDRWIYVLLNNGTD